MNDYLLPKRDVVRALAADRMTLEDYDPTIFGLVWDGADWTIQEDSLTEGEALYWADQVASYGERVGLFRWEGVQVA